MDGQKIFYDDIIKDNKCNYDVITEVKSFFTDDNVITLYYQNNTIYCYKLLTNDYQISNSNCSTSIILDKAKFEVNNC